MNPINNPGTHKEYNKELASLTEKKAYSYFDVLSAITSVSRGVTYGADSSDHLECFLNVQSPTPHPRLIRSMGGGARVLESISLPLSQVILSNSIIAPMFGYG